MAFDSNAMLVHRSIGNTPLRRPDLKGGSDGPISWLRRNGDNLIGALLSSVEIAGGIALTATGPGAAAGIPMIVHGAANFVAEVGKVTATTVVENRRGSGAADVLDSSLPDSAIGFIALGITGGNERAGAVGDLIDVGVSLGIGVGAARATDTLVGVAQTARRVGVLNSPESLQVARMARTGAQAAVADGIVNGVGLAADAWSGIINAQQFANPRSSAMR